MGCAWHVYPDVYPGGNPAYPSGDTDGGLGSTQTAALNIMTAGYPVVITEFGENGTAGTVGAPLSSNVLPWADSNMVSYLGWTWNPWGGANSGWYILIKDIAGTPTDGYGVYVKAHYICRASGKASCP
jgi:hypothetical protein